MNKKSLSSDKASNKPLRPPGRLAPFLPLPRLSAVFSHATPLFMSIGLLLAVIPCASADRSADRVDEHDQMREAHLERALQESHARLEASSDPAASPAATPMQLAQAEKEAPVKEERDVTPTAQRALTPEEIVAAIKLRAQREVAKRRARKWSLSNLATWTMGEESNPGVQQKSHKSSLYMEEYLSTTFSYKCTPQLTWQASYSLDALNYDEYTDGSTLTNSLTTKLIYRPLKTIRVEAHYSFDDSDYPYDIGASTWDQKVHLRLRQSFLKNYYHYIGWTHLNKQYKRKFKRESTSARIIGKRRHDQRDTGIYEIGGTFWEANTLKVRQEFYFNDSNEGYLDYNDAQNYKVKVSFNRDWTKQWSSASSFTYERKVYEDRTVSQPGVAERDNTKTYETGLTYKFTPDVDLTYTLKFKRAGSNDPGQVYHDITNSLALTASF